MIYALPVLIFSMLGYMFWMSTFKLRRDRLHAMKNADRSGIILSRRQRVRLNLTRAFTLPGRDPEWEAGLIANLGENKSSGRSGSVSARR